MDHVIITANAWMFKAYRRAARLKSEAMRSWPAAEKLLRMAMVACLAFMLSAQLDVFAAGTNSISTIIGNLISIIVSMFRYIGIIVLVWGVVQMALSFLRDDADTKATATKVIIVGALLVGLSLVISKLGITELENIDDNILA